MSRVVFINRFYHPDEQATAQLLTDLAEELAQRGHDVSVIASMPAQPSSASERRREVLIHRVRTTQWGRHHVAGRLMDFATFYLSACWRLFRTLRGGDIAVVMTDPPLLGLIVQPIVSFRAARLVHWVQDIYPEIAVQLSHQRWLLALRPFRNAAWRNAVACFVPGTDMASTLSHAGVAEKKTRVSPNWAPRGLAPAAVEDVHALRRSWKLEGKFVVAYSGNLGRVHDLLPLIDVAAALRDDPDVTLVFIGNGAQRATLESAVRERQLTNVQFRPPQPRSQLATSLSLGDLHAVTLRPGIERCVFPSKLYGAAAVGRPLLFIGPGECELARLVHERGLGAAFSRDETTAIAGWISRLRRDAAQRQDFETAALAFAATGFSDAASQWHDALGRELAAKS